MKKWDVATLSVAFGHLVPLRARPLAARNQFLYMYRNHEATCLETIRITNTKTKKPFKTRNCVRWNAGRNRSWLGWLKKILKSRARNYMFLTMRRFKTWNCRNFHVVALWKNTAPSTLPTAETIRITSSLNVIELNRSTFRLIITEGNAPHPCP